MKKLLGFVLAVILAGCTGGGKYEGYLFAYFEGGRGGEALRFAELRPEDTLIDVYCGAGTISLMMARHCRQVTGIEIVPAAVLNARENAQRNEIRNASFIEGKAEELLPKMVKDGQRPDVIVVDPPRSGIHPKAWKKILSYGVPQLLYISCNPKTMVQNLQSAADYGYRLGTVKPYDNFPFTKHIESVCLLTRE